ncbi:glycosyltransferase [Asticcacaulis sp. ZE23SCel15]|uniref:glycosyltransferase family 2 protein n=1 Tax=Asticcacaulis sp. ZE23SCel15 TaxID=3059027 RepID=UPI00265E7E93|nr:glycosyltransferase [Asticcacaulis sp. ZE23SCel15]WKL57040.1 glycosyltransferase [Asticcacaulis sp. ZE23SCel15]
MSHLKIDIGIATAGRRDILSDVINFMGRMKRPANKLIICPAKPEDVDAAALTGYGAPIEIVSGPTGLPAQRNVIIEASDADVIVFFDDDFLPSEDFLIELEALMTGDPSIVVATGHVVADGALGPGLEFAEGVDIVKGLGPNDDSTLEPTYNGYGCNMAIRMDAVRKHNIRFDEALPLYAWFEDVDFSRQLAPYGTIVRSYLLRGVHLGTKKAGRSPGKRLGYSQVANRIYLARKKTLSWPAAIEGIAKHLAANLVRSIAPEPWADRRGRLIGNLKALSEWPSGRMSPGRILDSDLKNS